MKLLGNTSRGKIVSALLLRGGQHDRRTAAATAALLFAGGMFMHRNSSAGWRVPSRRLFSLLLINRGGTSPNNSVSQAQAQAISAELFSVLNSAMLCADRSGRREQSGNSGIAGGNCGTRAGGTGIGMHGEQ